MSLVYRGSSNRKYNGKLKGVILDWAGTTVDYGSCAPTGVFVETFRRQGIEITSAQARIPMGLDKKMHIAALLQMEPVSTQWQKRFGRKWNAADVDQLYHDFIPTQLNCLKEYSQLIPGTLEAMHNFRSRELKVGTTTGYNREMIEIVAAEARKQDFCPDSIVCSSDVTCGRPQPWMALQAAYQMQVFPIKAIVKIGDTIADIEEGLNAGMWTIGLAKTGNELGLTEAEVNSLPPIDLKQRLEQSAQRLLQSGAHFVVNGIHDVTSVLDEINQRLAHGENP